VNIVVVSDEIMARINARYGVKLATNSKYGKQSSRYGVVRDAPYFVSRSGRMSGDWLVWHNTGHDYELAHTQGFATWRSAFNYANHLAWRDYNKSRGQ
jgi:hypothetical protein